MRRLPATVFASVVAGALATACSFILDVEPLPPQPPQDEDAALGDADADATDAGEEN